MTPEEAAALRAPFPESAIGKLPKAGVQLDYVGHAATTDRLLTVDPDWTWEPFATTADGLPLISGGGLWIRLTVCGVTRPGFGDGASIKEQIGDAIRNAAMRFGVAIDLWAKEDLHEIANPPEPVEYATPAQVVAVNAALDALADGPKAAARRWWSEQGFGSLKQGTLTATQAAAVLAHLAEPETVTPS